MTMRSITNFLTLLLALAGCVVAIVLTYEEYHPKADIGCSKLGGDCAKTIHSSYGHLGPIPTSLFGLGMYVTVAGLCIVRHNALRRARRAEMSHSFPDPPAPNTGGDEPGLSNLHDGEGLETLSDESLIGIGLNLDEPPRAVRSPAFSEARLPDAPTPIDPTVNRLNVGVWAIALSAVVISWWLQNASLFELCSFCPWCFSSATLVTLMFLVSSYDFLLAGRKLDGEQRLLAGVSAFIVVCFAFVATPVIFSRIKACGPQRGAPDHIVVDVDKRALILSSSVDYLKFKGDPKAKYALIEFGDYQCSHCKKSVERVDKLLKSPPAGGVRFAFRNFPFPKHPWALPSALAAEAAGEQGKFWQMHDLIFQNQEEMEKEDFRRDRFDQWAKSLGLDVKRFDKDSDSSKMLDRIKKDQNAADSTGLQITPSFYLVTPTQVTLLAGTDDLEKMWGDPKSPFWK